MRRVRPQWFIVLATIVAIFVAAVVLTHPRTPPGLTTPTTPAVVSAEASPAVVGAAPQTPSRDAITGGPSRRRLSKNLPKRRAVAVERPRVLVEGVSASALRREAGRLGLRVVREGPQSGRVIVDAVRDDDSASALAARIEASGLGATARATVPVFPAARPNDTYFGIQWGYENTGQSGGLPGADAKAVPAWDWSRGDGTVVAIIDTGVDLSHADLAGKAWVNTAEQGGVAGADDDGNGYVDDVNGYDFLNGDGTVFDYGDGDTHGTHVAGTVGAATNNALGMSGMGWNTRVMALKFLATHSGSDADAADAIRYAVDMGADVINASWGGPTYSADIESAIAYAAAHDVLFVCAAGNEASNIDATPYYPASLPATNVISVAALDRSDGKATFTNTGATGVDLGAPGVAIASTVPRLPGALFVDDAPHRSVYLSYPLESITSAAVRNQMMAAAMGALATSTADPVLLVDDAWQSLSAAYEATGTRQAAYLSMLGAAGYSSVTTWSTEVSGTPPSEVMAGKTVVWFTGGSTFAIPTIWPLIETHGTLTTAERTEVGEFLDGGGRLFISSGDLAYEMLYLAATKGTLGWFRTYLHARYVSDDPLTGNIAGRTGTIFSGLTGYVDDYIRWSDGCDEIGPYDSAASVIALWPHDYLYMDGTSMASPHVAGAVALVKSRTPTLTAETIKQRILDTADPVASIAGLSVTGARLDAASAVGTLSPPSALAVWPAGSGDLTVSWRNPGDADYDHTRVLYRTDGLPTGPLDASATVLYEGTGTVAPHSGVATGTTVYYSAYARATLGGWSSASTLVTTVADPPAGVPIPAGTNVVVTYENLTLTFPYVSGAGWLSITRVPPNREAPAGAMWVGDDYFEIHPVGEVGLPVDVAVQYDPADVSGSESALRFHHDTGGVWEDVTLGVDTASDTVYARTSSFSDFGLDEPLGGPSVDASAGDGRVAGLVVALVALAVALRDRRTCRTRA